MMLRRSHRSQRGFTLMEMIIAIAIFALMAAVAYGSLSGFLDNRDRIVAKQQELAEIQLALALLERDIRFAVPRPVRDDIGEPEGAFVVSDSSPIVAGEKLRMTTSVPTPPIPLAGDDEKSRSSDESDNDESSQDSKAPEDNRSEQSLVRVAWRVEDGDLYRIAWTVLDRDSDDQEKRRRVLSDVAEFKVSALSVNAESGDVDSSGTWPSEDESFSRSANPDAQSFGGKTIDGAPDGIELSLALNDGRTYQRVLEMAAPPVTWEKPDYVAPKRDPQDPNDPNQPNRPRPTSQPNPDDPDNFGQENDDGQFNDQGQFNQNDGQFNNQGQFNQDDGQFNDPSLEPEIPGTDNPGSFDQTQDPDYEARSDPNSPQYDPNYNPLSDPNSPLYDPDYNPLADPSSPQYDPSYNPSTDPNSPEFDPTLDPNYDPSLDPNNPAYDPTRDPNSSQYQDPYEQEQNDDLVEPQEELLEEQDEERDLEEDEVIQG